MLKISVIAQNAVVVSAETKEMLLEDVECDPLDAVEVSSETE